LDASGVNSKGVYNATKEITMRHGTNNKRVTGTPRTSLEQPASGSAVMERSREQLLGELSANVCQLTGTHSYDVGDRIIDQVANAQVWPKPQDEDDHVINAMSLIGEMAPQNATEAMLAVQMIATNEAALMFMKRATMEDQSTEGSDANVLRATRLMRVFIQQLEAIQKMRSKAGQQNLTSGRNAPSKVWAMRLPRITAAEWRCNSAEQPIASVRCRLISSGPRSASSAAGIPLSTAQASSRSRLPPAQSGRASRWRRRRGNRARLGNLWVTCGSQRWD
jgi:hypothetical protein